MKTISAVRDIVRQRLRDEFETGKDLEWANDELDLLIFDCVSEISKHSPYEKKETLTTTAGSKELDISSIEGLLDLAPGHEIEFRVGNEPPSYHNASIFGDTLRMDIDTIPAAGENVYLYCHKLHEITDSSSTLKPELEDILVLGVCAKAAMSRARTLINKVNVGGTKTPTEMQAWGTAQFSLYKSELLRVTTQRMWREYPKS